MEIRKWTIDQVEHPVENEANVSGNVSASSHYLHNDEGEYSVKLIIVKKEKGKLSKNWF